MATIDEIFNSMPEVAAEGDHEYLVIDPVNRTISVPESERIFAVVGDEVADRKYFLCPRYVGDGLDLAGMFLTVYFRNAGGDEDGYLVKDLAVAGDYVTFSWLLSDKVAAYEGDIQFGVCADLPNTAEKKRPDWNTTMASGEVLEGLHPALGDVAGETSDVVTQLREEIAASTAAVEAAGAAQVTKVQTEGSTQVNTVKATGAQTEADALAAIKAQGEATLATIPAEYTALVAQVDKLTRDRAAAIVCQAEGEVLQITDAGNDPLQGLRIFGKTKQWKTTGANLLQSVAKSGAVYGVSFTAYDDGRVFATGTATQAAYLTLAGGYAAEKQPIPDWLVPGEKYVISDAGLFLYSEDGKQTSFTNMGFTMPEGYAYYGVFVRVSAGVTVNKLYYPMLNAGAEALTWEPYSGGVPAPCPAWPQELQSAETPTVSVFGKNLMDWDRVLAALTTSPADMTMETGDRRVVLSGTPTSNFWQCNDKLTEIPAAWRGRTMYLSATLAGTEPYLVMYIKDANNNSLPSASLSATGTCEFVMPENAAYYLFAFCLNKKTVGAAVTAEYSNLHLGLTAESGEAYKQAQELTISSPGGLPGIPVATGGNYTDAAGQHWIADEVDLARGVYVQRVGRIVFDGSQSYHINAYQQEFGYYVFGCTKTGASYSEAPMLADKLNFKPWGYFTVDNIGDFICYEAYSFYISLADQSIQTVEAFQEYLAANPITALYTLATPVETALTDAEIQAYLALQSYKPTTTVLNDAGAHMVLEYAADPTTYIDNKLAALVAANN